MTLFSKPLINFFLTNDLKKESLSINRCNQDSDIFSNVLFHGKTTIIKYKNAGVQ